ncbi:uncharacterized protein LOC62_04G005225 [Vanrija pseudolonga]|uniref:Purtative membrane protein n=1 Tax=Vanrija pseudolonga TaxID=143232 RepID=A0AAF1BHZ2_9TREE|nr:purtative membrane protein [Vanrija pseudolonga]
MDPAPRTALRWHRKAHVVWVYAIVIGLTATLVIPAASRREEMIRLVCHVVEPIASRPTISRHDAGWDLETCKRSVKVQRRVAHINMVSHVASDLLGAATTAAWSSLSDRVGRCRILTVAVVGQALKGLSFLHVLVFPQSMVRTGGSVLYVGPVVDGLLGGEPLLAAVYTAYLADVTSVDNMAINTVGFSTVAAAIAVAAPMIGPALVSASGDRLLPFEFTLGLQIIFGLFVWLVIPESLSKDKRDTAQAEASQASAALQRSGRPGAAGDGGAQRSSCARLGRVIRRASHTLMRHSLAPLESLAVFRPVPRQPGDTRKGRDWNLFYLASVIFLLALAREESPEVQYVMFSFGWGQVELGRRASLIAMWRTATVCSIIPLYRFVVKPFLVKRIVATAHGDTSEEAPLLSDGGGDAESLQTRANIVADLVFLGTSILIECLGYIAKGANSAGSFWPYAIGTAVALAGAPGSLVLNPLLLELGPPERPAGRIFGASAVLSAVGGTLLNSLLFNTVFGATIGWYPPTLFVVAAGLYLIALVCVILVQAARVPRQ